MHSSDINELSEMIGEVPIWSKLGLPPEMGKGRGWPGLSQQ
jgi:hypothetical protein